MQNTWFSEKASYNINSNKFLLITLLEKALAYTEKWKNKTKASIHKQFAGDNSKSEPPDPFPNSEVKPLCADGSVGLPMWE